MDMDIKKLKEKIKEDIEKLNNLPRKHASFYNWHDKKIQEVGLGLYFFQKLEEISCEYLVDIKNAEDPPDVKIVTNQGRTIGVEITELVDQKAIEYQIKNDPRYEERVLSWNHENTIEAITSIIEKKDHLCRDVPTYYNSIFLLIFTDEQRLISDTLKQYVDERIWPETKNINEIFILTGYEPKHGTKCLLKLKQRIA